MAPSSQSRAVGVVRVSRVGDRDGESFVSPSEQKERIGTACVRDGLTLVSILEEPNVSGGAPLSRRHGLREAVELVEAGEADAIVVAYFDRLVRSLAVQAEVVERVERAGGAILAVDVGEVRADTASRWLSSTMLGMVAEYHRRVTAERTKDAKRRAVERGVPPFPKIPAGYRRAADRSIEPDPDTAPLVADAFRLRAEGATIKEVREQLRAHGIERSFHGVQAMLGSRLYVGELRFGEHVRKDPDLAIVESHVFDAVQRAKSQRGRRPKSERLLSRLGVLRCATCGARMVIGSTKQNGKPYWFYRCPPIGDCQQRVTISAEVAERAVVEAVQEQLDGLTGSASLDTGIANVRADLERIEAELAAAVRAFTGLDDVDAVREKLTTLREERDSKRAKLDELTAAVAPALTLTARDWRDLTFEGRRALVRAVIARATVSPGRGPDRISIELRTEA